MITYPSQLPAHTTFGTFQSNHDNVVNRPASSYAGATAAPRLYLAAALSLWRWHQTLLKLRKESPAWDDPAIAALTSPAGVLAWLVTGNGGERVVVAANVTVSGLSGDLSQAHTVLGSLPAFAIRACALDEEVPSVARDSDVVALPTDLRARF